MIPRMEMSSASCLGNITWYGQSLSSSRFIQGESDQCGRPCARREWKRSFPFKWRGKWLVKCQGRSMGYAAAQTCWLTHHPMCSPLQTWTENFIFVLEEKAEGQVWPYHGTVPSFRNGGIVSPHHIPLTVPSSSYHPCCLCYAMRYVWPQALRRPT